MTDNIKDLTAPALSDLPGWTIGDSFAARAEGWDIWDSDGSENGPYQIQAVDDDDKLADDNAAWAIVTEGLMKGTPLHSKAIDFIREHNPIEYKAINDWLQKQRRLWVSKPV